ncbi:MAG TPA: Spy/CpxP family protein refolding chaperone [Bryobacterales bacterium]|nr:Spy/CpxP family protein refolding chaperone [Bryobacterales bacterium]
MSPASVTGVALAGRAAFAQAAPQTPHAGMRGPDRMLQHAQIVLDLSDSQVSQIRSILQQSMQDNRSVMQQARQARQALLQAAENGKTDQATLKPLADQVGQAASQLALAHAQTFGEIYNILTPAQREKANKLHDLFGQRLRGGPLQ